MIVGSRWLDSQKPSGPLVPQPIRRATEGAKLIAQMFGNHWQHFRLLQVVQRRRLPILEGSQRTIGSRRGDPDIDHAGGICDQKMGNLHGKVARG